MLYMIGALYMVINSGGSTVPGFGVSGASINERIFGKVSFIKLTTDFFFCKMTSKNTINLSKL